MSWLGSHGIMHVTQQDKPRKGRGAGVKLAVAGVAAMPMVGEVCICTGESTVSNSLFLIFLDLYWSISTVFMGMMNTLMAVVGHLRHDPTTFTTSPNGLYRY